MRSIVHIRAEKFVIECPVEVNVFQFHVALRLARVQRRACVLNEPHAIDVFPGAHKRGARKRH